ncbi:hypothetical protein V5P93_003225 [Actinokineospora auranticolor]|uniref:DUF7144 domain-containing protein n=1 Tax=Actinokineospora auranticolor TaxID=155976 RepID=A0A2S6H1R0_9PSEU|nr:hypothetical protein [Actinokineospora auranticolor]PPK71360.1 hypothetical protein CLV40_101550 [Actinokineospora auranticolor]
MLSGPQWTSPRERKRVSGWLTFGGLVVFLVGAIDVGVGLVALTRSGFYRTPDGDLLVFDYTAWGWIWLVFGLIGVVSGIGVQFGALWARVGALALALLSVVGHLLFLPAYPLWSIVAITLSVLVVYAVVVPPLEAVGA